MMSGGAVAMSFVVLVTVGVTAYLVGTLARSISNEKKTELRLWKNFGLSLGFCALFFISWLAQGVAQWQVYTGEQRDHKESVEIGDFVSDFSQSTLENWQSEFLQLFSFTIMAAVLIHKGSAESRDSDDLILSSLKRIEDELGTEPTLRQSPWRQDETLHVLPDGFEGWMLRDGVSLEPEGYFDTQEEAIRAATQLSRIKHTAFVIHSPDGSPRESKGGDS
jgi:hypothetical protein